MAWLSRVNFTASDVLSYTDLNNLGNDIRAWGGNVNGGGYTLSNIAVSASSGTMATINGGTGASSTLTVQSTSGAGTSDAIIFKTASQSERMRIDSSGSVGIGTSSQQTRRLHVHTTSGDRHVYITDNAPSVTLGNNEIYTSSTMYGLLSLSTVNGNYGQNAGTFILATYGNSRGDIHINSNYSGTGIRNVILQPGNGNVGIGTTSPKQPLHVAGQGVFTTSNASYDPGDSAGTAVRIGYSTGGDYGYVICNQTGVASKRLLVGGSTVEFLVSGAEKGRFNSDGKFGIGTTSPLTTLQVGAVAALNGDVTLSAGTLMAYQAAADGATLTWNANTNGGNTNTIMAQLKPRQDTSANYNLDVFCGTWNNNNSAGTAVATFQSTGRVGIGTASPTYQLQLSTDSAAKPTTNTWTIASDARLKTVKGEYSKGLAEICQVRPVLYEYNGRGGIVADGKEHISILAQELAEVFPECVGTFKGKLNESDAEETDLYNYNGHAITFALINAIKELKAEIDLLKSRN